MKFGEKLKIARTRQKMTQENFANRLNVSRTAVSNWENERNYPDLKTLIEISNLLDITLDELLKEDIELLQKIEDDSHELEVLKIRQTRGKKIITLLLILSMLVSAYLWINYLFFYNPWQGAFLLMGCTFSGLSGLLLASTLENKPLRIFLIILNSLLTLSFPLLFLFAMLLGFNS